MNFYKLLPSFVNFGHVQVSFSPCQLFNKVFFKKSTPRHATSATSICTNLRRNSTRVAACSFARTRVNTRNSKPARCSRNRARIRVITRITPQFFNSQRVIVHVPSILSHGERSLVDATALSISVQYAISFNPCFLYRSGIQEIAPQFFVFEISFPNAI